MDKGKAKLVIEPQLDAVLVFGKHLRGGKRITSRGASRRNPG
jgi:hypothetical protein